jgi:hypothetical protein
MNYEIIVMTLDAPDNPAFFMISGMQPDTEFSLPDIRPDSGYGTENSRISGRNAQKPKIPDLKKP